MTRSAPGLAAGLALAATVLVLVAWASPGVEAIDVAWLSPLGSRLALGVDPLAAPMAVFTAALAVAIFVYTSRYLPEHLRRHERPQREIVGFCASMALFVASMLLLVLARDLVIVFLALELSAVVSYLLIAFDRESEEARRAASLALVVTVGSSLLFAVGLVLVAARTGTTVIPELARRPEAIGSAAATCLALGVLGKSAQVPLHIWLPRAMVAPTPVSAYLHSAALVAAGVYVLARIRVLLEPVPAVLDVLVVVGFASVLVGGTLAFVGDELKRVLAYSTIAQYGYAVAMVGVGGDAGCTGVALFLVAHGLCKCALFLTAGVVTTTTRVDALSRTGGLARGMPMLAVASAIAAAGLAGLPLTIGWWKDDLLLTSMLERSPALGVLAAAAIAMTLAYAARWWLGIFTGGARPGRVHSGAPALLVGPIVVLALAIVLGGVWIDPLADAFVPAGATVAGHAVDVELAYAFHLAPHTMLTIAAWIVAGLAIWQRRRIEPLLGRVVDHLARVGPARLVESLGKRTGQLSDGLHRLELRDLRKRLTAVVWPTTVLVALGVVATGLSGVHLGPLGLADLPLATSLLVSAFAALAALRRAHHVTRIILLSFVGFGLGLAFTLWGAPDVALVIVLIETTLTILFLAFLWHLPRRDRRRGEMADRASRGWLRNSAGVAAGLSATALALLTLGGVGAHSVAESLESWTPLAHSESPVAAVLADFRGLDTAGELTVLAIAILGAIAISRGQR